MQEVLICESLKIVKILEDLKCLGATSVKVLNENFRQSLLNEAKNYTYNPEDKVVGSGDKVVKQDMGTFEDFRPESNYFLLIKSFQYLLDQSLHELSFYPFENPLLFNATVLQKYEKGSIGITPHRDSLRYINLVCIFIISGQGKFFVCSNRLGSDAVELDATVGIIYFPNFVFIDFPRAIRNIVLLPCACGEKNLVTSSSKNVRPLAPRPSPYAPR